MFATLTKMFLPITSLFLFIIGNSLLMTLLPIRLNISGSSSFIVGLVAASYYFGFVVGALYTTKLITRIGHIRSFAIFASFTSALAIAYGIIVVPWAWILFRFATGAAFAGLLMVIDSWLLSISTADIRNRILAIYLSSYFGAQIIGQFLLNINNPKTLLLFAIAGMLCATSVIPISIVRYEFKIIKPKKISLKDLLKVSNISLSGSLTTGIIGGSLYGLLPLYLARQNLPIPDIAFYMGMLIFGGTILQYPIGRISDYFDRRAILFVNCLLIISISLGITYTSPADELLFAVLVFLLGGVVFSIYPICISHACDIISHDEIISSTSGHLFVYGIGAAIGPLLAPLFIRALGLNGLFIYFIVLSFILSTYIFILYISHQIKPIRKHRDFVAIPRTTPIASQLDPRKQKQQSSPRK